MPQVIDSSQSNSGMSDAMLQQFANAQQKNEMAELLKELFDEGKIFMITDVSKDEAIIMTRIYMVAKMKNITIWLDGLAYYCKILLSVGRKSRRELISAIGSASMNPMRMMGNQSFFGLKR